MGRSFGAGTLVAREPVGAALEWVMGKSSDRYGLGRRPAKSSWCMRRRSAEASSHSFTASTCSAAYPSPLEEPSWPVSRPSNVAGIRSVSDATVG